MGQALPMMNDELTPPLPLPGEGWFVVGPMTGGCALLAPVYDLAPLQGALPMSITNDELRFSLARQGAKAASRGR